MIAIADAFDRGAFAGMDRVDTDTLARVAGLPSKSVSRLLNRLEVRQLTPAKSVKERHDRIYEYPPRIRLPDAKKIRQPEARLVVEAIADRRLPRTFNAALLYHRFGTTLNGGTIGPRGHLPKTPYQNSIFVLPSHETDPAVAGHIQFELPGAVVLSPQSSVLVDADSLGQRHTRRVDIERVPIPRCPTSKQLRLQFISAYVRLLYICCRFLSVAFTAQPPEIVQQKGGYHRLVAEFPGPEYGKFVVDLQPLAGLPTPRLATLNALRQ